MLNCVRMEYVRVGCARTAAVSRACLLMGLLACVSAIGTSARAQSTVVLPLGADSAAGFTGNSIPIGNFSTGVLQVMYSEDQMAGVPIGSTITAIQMRQWNFNSTGWPASAMVLPKFELRIGTSSLTPATMSTTFATNFASMTTVRSGTLSLGAGAYPAGGATGATPEPWGPVISFSAPYVYPGGALVLEFRTENSVVTGNFSADVYSAPGKTAYASAQPSTATATPSTIQQGAGIAVRLTYTPAPKVFQAGITRLVIMDDLVNQRGNSANIYPLGNAARTIQLIADTSEMRRLGLGSNFVGLSYRNAAASNWPVGPQSFTKYDITLARALNTPATMSDTIASNTGPDATVVRSGALAIASGAMGALGPSPRPAPWTFQIPFSTPYSYTGGPLLTVVRHDGVTGAAANVAGVLTSDAEYGTRVKGRSSNISSSVLAATDSALSYTEQMWSIDSGTVAPNARTSVRGPSLLATPLADSAQTSQFIISGSELTYIPMGSQITGISFRGRGAGTLPVSASAFTSYSIEASTARNRPQTASTNFAANEGADKVLVRSGGLVIPANGFPGGSVVNPWGTLIQFDRAFIYQGGDLCITLRHSGGSVAQSIDGDSDTSITRTISAAGSGSTSGSLASGGPIVRFAFNPSVVAPAAMDNTPGGVGYSVFHSAAGSVLQEVYSADQLRSLRVGSVITGMSMRRFSRFAGGTIWPAADVNVNRFDVTMSTSPVGPGAMSDTFANNIGADAILVKSGPITIPASSFPYVQSDTRPNENLWFIQFTEPFVYKGGPLSVTIRNDSNASALTSCFMDAIEGSASAAAGRWSIGVSPDATVHNQGSSTGALALRLVFVPKSYCPADLNNDGFVEDADFVIFVAAYNILDCADGSMAEGCASDLNHDRVVDDADFQAFVMGYNQLVCP